MTRALGSNHSATALQDMNPSAFSYVARKRQNPSSPENRGKFCVQKGNWLIFSHTKPCVTTNIPGKSQAVTSHPRHLWNGLIEASHKQQVGDPELSSSIIDQECTGTLGSGVLGTPFRVWGPEKLE